MEDRKFTTADAARYCELSYHTLIYNVGKGKLIACERMSNGEPMFLQSELDRFMESRKPEERLTHRIAKVG